MFDLKKPCADCPFRSDKPFYLGTRRRKQIAEALRSDQTFDCHRTVHYEEERWGPDGGYVRAGDEHHCAGALIVLEKEGIPNQMMRIGERVGLYDRHALEMAAPVYDTLDEFTEGE